MTMEFKQISFLCIFEIRMNIFFAVLKDVEYVLRRIRRRSFNIFNAHKILKRHRMVIWYGNTCCLVYPTTYTQNYTYRILLQYTD